MSTTSTLTEGLDHALLLLPKGLDLTNEEEFIQAGILLVSIRNQAVIALGELLAWKMARENAGSDESRDAIFARYAHEWGTSRTSLVRAWVLAVKFPDVERPEDVNWTTAYEVLSGAKTAAEAEAGFEAVTSQGLGVEKVREAKLLQAEGLADGDQWSVPFMFFRGRDIWARSSDGHEVKVWESTEDESDLARAARAISRRRLHL